MYVEVPTYELNTQPEESLKLFLQDIPTLDLVGCTHTVLPEMPYNVDDEVQLVCRYIDAYKKTGNKGLSVINFLAN